MSLPGSTFCRHRACGWGGLATRPKLWRQTSNVLSPWPDSRTWAQRRATSAVGGRLPLPLREGNRKPVARRRGQPYCGGVARLESGAGRDPVGRDRRNRPVPGAGHYGILLMSRTY
jgi:hypothetical protein